MKKQYKIAVWARYPTGTYALRYSSYHRKPQTMNERRANYGAVADGFHVRAKRVKGLPHAWDDLNHSFLYKRCWKRFTKQGKQWKCK